MDDGPGMEEHDAGYGRELTPLGGSAQGSALWWLAMDRQDAIDAQIQSKMGVLDSLLAHTDSALDSMKAKPTAGWDAQEGGGIACTAAEGANGDSGCLRRVTLFPPTRANVRGIASLHLNER